MFVSLMELIIAGMVTGAACMYTFQNQKRITLLFILLFACCFYLGFVISSHQWMRVTEAVWIFDVLRMTTAAALAVFGLLSFVPYHGFFHSHGRYIWLSVSMLFLYTGWHAGHWLTSIVGFAVLLLLFIMAFVAGNTLQSKVHFKLRGKSFVPYLPFTVLLFFSFLMLL